MFDRNIIKIGENKDINKNFQSMDKLLYEKLRSYFRL